MRHQTCVSHVSGDLSSISGSEDSDSASEEDLQILDEERVEFEKSNRSRGFCSHRVLFQNAQGQFLYAYRCVLGPHQVSDGTHCVVNSNLLYIQPRFTLSPVHFSLFPFLFVWCGYHTWQHSPGLNWPESWVKCHGIVWKQNNLGLDRSSTAWSWLPLQASHFLVCKVETSLRVVVLNEIMHVK